LSRPNATDPEEASPHDPQIVVYSDGSAEPNPGRGGWAAVIYSADGVRVLSGNESWTTNNRMELMAAVSALEALPAGVRAQVYTDSSYLQRGISDWSRSWERKGWRRRDKPIPNADLWQRLVALNQERKIEWLWTRGHGGDRGNELAHRLATDARDGRPVPEEAEQQELVTLGVAVACRQPGGPGGWAVVLEDKDGRRSLSGREPRATANLLELKAVIEGLRSVPAGSEVEIVTTSEYVWKGATAWIHRWRRNGWRTRAGTEVAHRQLWEELDQLLGAVGLNWKLAAGYSDSSALKEAATLASEAAETAAARVSR
jgi:ribonuclease HI